ncbi:MAG: SDR family oxidoreductase [Bacteroidetes bacterium]|jgi:short-subunit dehydrogenase|nr:SDR family oxidoreductase [Bacteroidota bacterium]
MKCHVVVTGASRGIGFAVAHRFAQEGHHLAIVARNAGDLTHAKEQLLSAGAAAVHTVVADLSSPEQIAQSVTTIQSIFGQVHVLVNNAGLFLGGTMMGEPAGQFQHLMNTNVLSAYEMTRGLWTQLQNTPRAHVFNMCSIASITAYAAGGSYSVAKFALMGFSKSLRLEGMPFGIRVSAVLPGATLTDSWAGVDLPKERFMDPKDVAEAIFMAFQINEHTVMEEILLRPMLGDI